MDVDCAVGRMMVDKWASAGVCVYFVPIFEVSTQAAVETLVAFRYHSVRHLLLCLKRNVFTNGFGMLKKFCLSGAKSMARITKSVSKGK